MYDRRLDAIVAASKLGSFTRAAEQLRISTPALVKQVSTFEGELGVTLFIRSHTGVSLTAAGELLVADAEQIIDLSKAALLRARGQGAPVRLGVSLMNPGKNTQALWPRIHEIAPDLQLEVVTIGDLYDPHTSAMTHLGDRVDVVQSSYSTVRWGGLCQLLPIFTTPFSVDVLRTSDLAERGKVSLNDLKGKRIRMLRHANDATDQLRTVLMQESDIEVVDAQIFDFALFNSAAEHGDAVLTSGAWSGVHPAFVGVTLDYPLEVPCFLAYPRDPAPHVQRFVDTMAQALTEVCQP